MLFDAAVILVTVPALVMNWRTQRAATMVVASAPITGPMTERWKSTVEMLAGGADLPGAVLDGVGPSRLAGRSGAGPHFTVGEVSRCASS